jgi:hypothetical protein
MNDNELLKFEPITASEADIFLKALIKTKVIIKDFNFGAATFYRVNAVENMDLPEDSESAIAKGLHLLLCNEYLLTVKKKSPVNKAVECADLLVYKPDWNKIPEHERRERFIYIPVQIQIERKNMSFN